MTDIVEKLRELEAVESELACECDCPPEATANYRYAMTCAEAAAEIARLRAEVEQNKTDLEEYRLEVERLNKSRNKWGQKYNKLLEQHKVTVSQLKTAVWSDSEECKLLTAEVERLRSDIAYADKHAVKVESLLWGTAKENEKLRAALEAWAVAVRIDVVMEGPQYMGVSSTLGRKAWEKTRTALEEK